MLGLVLPTNADDIAQDNEIGLSGTSNFGTTVSDRDMDPNIQRQGDTEITATISHQLAAAAVGDGGLVSPHVSGSPADGSNADCDFRLHVVHDPDAGHLPRCDARRRDRP